MDPNSPDQQPLQPQNPDNQAESDAAVRLEHGGNGGRGRQEAPPPPIPEVSNLWRVATKYGVQEAVEAVEIILNDAFIAEALKDNPNMNGRAMEDMRDFIRSKIKSNEREHGALVEAMFTDLRRVLESAAAQSRNPVEAKKNALNVGKVLFEQAVEELIGVADDSPELQYQKVFQPTFTQSEYIATLKDTAKVFDDPSAHGHPQFSDYIRELIIVRGEAHNLRLSIKYGKQYQEEVLQLGLQAFQFLQDDITGLPEVVRLYERAAASQVAKAGTWFTAQDERAVQAQVRDAFAKLAGIDANGKIQTGPDGRPLPALLTKDGRQLTDWEVRRAIRMGENMFYSTQRMAMYSGMGNLPSISAITERIGSLPGGEYQVRYLYAAKIAARFAAGNDTAEHFWDKVYRELAGDQKAHGGKYTPKRTLKGVLTGEVQQPSGDDPRDTSIFGLQKRTLLVNSLGAVDVESQSWRSVMIYLGSIRFTDGSTMLEQITKRAEQIMNDPKFGFASPSEKNISEMRDPILGGGSLTAAGKDELGRQIGEMVLGQRLYLSILAKNGNLPGSLKAQIWEKMALLNPSTVASMWPGSVEGNSAWGTLKNKLWLAEESRVARDARAYREQLSGADLHQEAQQFAQIKQIAKKSVWSSAEFQAILAYMHMDDVLGPGGSQALTAEERRLLQQVISTGIEHAKDIADATMPHTYCITDTPIVSWAVTKDGKAGVATEDMIRIYTGDQVAFGEGWGAVGGFVADPVKGDFVKSMQTGVQKVGMVIGNDGGQSLIEPFVTAWLKYTADQHPYTRTGRNLFRMPNSEFAKYNVGTFLSYDEEQRHKIIDSLVQAGVLSDNQEAAKAAGVLTMADRVRKKVAADLYARFLQAFRIMALLFGEEFALTFLKVALPDEAGKALPFK